MRTLHVNFISRAALRVHLIVFHFGYVHCRQMWPKSDSFAHVTQISFSHDSVNSTNHMESDLFNSDLCHFICGAKSGTSQMFCSATTVWTVISELMWLLHHDYALMDVTSKILHTQSYQDSCSYHKVSKLCSLLSYPCLYFSYCLHIISLAIAADHTINKCIITYFMSCMFTSIYDNVLRCHVHCFPAELGYFFRVAAGCFSTMWVEATPLTWYLCSFGLVLKINWVDFVVETWQPCSYCSFAHTVQLRTMVCSHCKSDIGHI